MRRIALLIAVAWAGAGPGSAQQLAGSAAVQSDPLKNFYGNTVVCLAAAGGQDLCHQWFNPDGSFINIDGGGAHTGHYVVSPPRADGKVQMCLYFDSPQEISVPRAANAGAPPPGAPGRDEGLVVVCRQKDFKTQCERNVDPKTVAPEDQKHITRSAGDAFYKGMCYPMGRHEVGDIWFETDDPMPRELGTDKLMLLGGRQ